MPSCAVPNGLKINNIQPTSVDLAWTDNNTPPATSWQISYGTAGFTPGKGTQQVITTNTFSLTQGLTVSIDYDWYIRAICATGDTSAWSAVNSFRVPCYSFSAPYSQTWDGTTVPAVDSCWQKYLVGKGSGPAGPVVRTVNTFSPRSAPNHLEFDNNYRPDNDTTAIISPQFSDMTAGDKRIHLWVKVISSRNRSNLWIGTMSDPNRGSATLNIIDTIVINGNTTYTQHSIDITAANGYNGTDSHIVLLHDNSGFFSRIYVDDFAYGKISPCTVPNNIVATSNIGHDSIELAWSSHTGGSIIQWGMQPFSGMGNFTGIVSSPYTFTGLTPNTAYEFWVADTCGGDTSAFAGPLRVTTEPKPISLEENPVSRSLKMFPNPTSEVVNIKFDAAQSGNASIRITDMRGRVMMERHDNHINGRYNEAIDVSNLADGVYMVEIQSGDLRAVRRLNVR